MKCDRCGKEKLDVKQMGVANYLGFGRCSNWHYEACEKCVHVIGCMLDNTFIEFSRDWKVPPRKLDKIEAQEE
jgi:hypothetical protein